MSENQSLSLNQGDIDLTRYLSIIYKNISTILAIVFLCILTTAIYESFDEKNYKSKIVISKSENLIFLVSPSFLENIENFGFSVDNFYHMQNKNFLNYESFQAVYDQLKLDNYNLPKINDLYSTLLISDIDEDSSHYSLELNNKEIIGKILSFLTINAEEKTMNYMSRYLANKIVETEDSIEQLRIDHHQNIDNRKTLLLHQLETLKNTKKIEILNQIDILKFNLNIAKKMGYIEPIFNDNELVIKIDNEASEFDSIFFGDGLYFMGSKILEEQVTFLEDQLQNLDFSKINPNISSNYFLLENEKNDAFIEDLLLLQSQLILFNNLSQELSNMVTDNKNSIITNYNLNSIDISEIGRSTFSIYVIVFILSSLISIMLVIIRHNYKLRIKVDENLKSELTII
jgi:LPS O-antigen subunit length determinant protein (WzzB/FepE family)